MFDNKRIIENKLARIASAMHHLRDVKQALENDLFDRVPAGRLDAHYNSISESLDIAIRNLSEVQTWTVKPETRSELQTR